MRAVAQSGKSVCLWHRRSRVQFPSVRPHTGRWCKWRTSRSPKPRLRVRVPAALPFRLTYGDGVTGNTADSGSVIGGSNPPPRAECRQVHDVAFYVPCHVEVPWPGVRRCLVALRLFRSTWATRPHRTRRRARSPGCRRAGWRNWASRTRRDEREDRSTGAARRIQR